MKDVLIIGAGPAGISASLYLARSGKANVTIAYYETSALSKATKIENYFGFAEALSGEELLENGRKGAERLGVTFIKTEILEISINADLRFEVTDTNGSKIYDAVLIAAGASRKNAAIPGIKEYEGKGISYCAVCDAFFHRNKAVAVIGNGEYAAHEANVLLNTASDVTILTDGKQLEADIPDRIKVNTNKINAIVGNGKISGVVFDNGETIDTDGIFIAIGTAGSSDLARKAGAATENGNIIVDENGMTTIPGLYAAGDCTGGVLQIATAVGEGAKAALGMIGFLK